MLHVLRNRSALTKSDLGFGTTPLQPEIDAHLAFAAMLASDPGVIRTRSSNGALVGSGGGSDAVDLVEVIRFLDIKTAQNAANVIDAFASNGAIRQLFDDPQRVVAAASSGSGAWYSPALQASHADVRNALVALRTLLIQSARMPKLPVSRVDLLGSGLAGSVTPTFTKLKDIYSRMFYRVSFTSVDAQAVLTSNVAEWAGLKIHPGEGGTFTGRILGLRKMDFASYWDLPFLTPYGSSNMGPTSNSLFRDVLAMTLLTKGDAFGNPDRMKADSIDAQKLDREDQQRATAEILSAHALALGLLQYIVTDAYFEVLLQQPWLKPLVAASLERSSLTGRFEKASSLVAPFRRCGGPLQELWGRLNPIQATLTDVMDSPHMMYGVPVALWTEMMTLASPGGFGATSVKDGLAKVKGVPLGDPSRRGVLDAMYRIREGSLISGSVDGSAPVTFLDKLVSNRLALADILYAADTRVSQALSLVLSDIGWTNAPTATRTIHPTLFGAPVLTDGVYSTEGMDIVDLRASRALGVMEQSKTATVLTSSSLPLKTFGYMVGSPVPRLDAMDSLGLPQIEEPRDYAAMSTAVVGGGAPLDLDSDARILPNTIDEWARQLNLTPKEFVQTVARKPTKWVHLFEVTAGTVAGTFTLTPTSSMAITSAKVARLSRSTVIVGIPTGEMITTADNFSDDAAGLPVVARNGKAQFSSHAQKNWSAEITVSGRYGVLAGGQDPTEAGPLYVAYHDSGDPAQLKAMASWAPPVVVADGQLETGPRFDAIEANRTLLARF